MNEFLTVKQACAILQVHGNTMLRWLNDGTIKGVKVGKLWRIPRQNLPRVEERPRDSD